MKDRVKDRIRRRTRRRMRVRKKVFGLPERPRLAVYRSNKYIYGQIINDIEGHTLVSMNDRHESVNEFINPEKKGKIGRSFAAGKALAKVALDNGITEVSFDRGGYIYRGRVRAFAEGAREGGLKF